MSHWFIGSAAAIKLRVYYWNMVYLWIQKVFSSENPQFRYYFLKPVVYFYVLIFILYYILVITPDLFINLN